MKEGKPENTREAQFGQSDKYQRIRDKNKELCTHNISNRRQRGEHAKGRKRAQRRKEKDNKYNWSPGKREQEQPFFMWRAQNKRQMRYRMKEK